MERLTQKLTKIVATIGPSSRNYDTIKALIENGANVFRLNFSHGSHEDHSESVQLIEKASEELKTPVAIFQDLQGPKIRVGKLKEEFLPLETGGSFILTTEEMVGDVIDSTPIAPIDYKNLHNEIESGARILLDDGLMELKVEKIEGQKIYTKVINGGNLKPRKGVNIPNIKLEISTMTEKDRGDLKFAFENRIDYVALSFVRDADDVKELKQIMQEKYGKTLPIISKIEKPEAFTNIDNIIAESDAIMVARGDLGVETSPQEVPIIQKTIIRKCRTAGIPTITATQMLESMITNPTPTRAEANDVANAILDRCDAIMLSGETAAGKYPVEAVKMMNKIANNVESSDIYETMLLASHHTDEEINLMVNKNSHEAVCFSAIALAENLGAKYIVAFSSTGKTGSDLSKHRPDCPIIVMSPADSTINKLCLFWGITPVKGIVYPSLKEQIDNSFVKLKEKKILVEDDFVVFTCGTPGGAAGGTNTIQVERA